MSDCQIVRLYSMVIIDRGGVKQYVMANASGAGPFAEQSVVGMFEER